MFHAVLQVTWFPWFPWVAAKATWGAEASFSAVAGQLTFRKTQELLRSQEFCSDSTRTRKGGPSGGHRKDQPQSDMGSEKFLTVLHFGGTQNNDGSRVDMICNCPGSSSMSWSLVKSMVNPKTDLREKRFLMHLPSKPPSNGMLRFLQIPGVLLRVNFLQGQRPSDLQFSWESWLPAATPHMPWSKPGIFPYAVIKMYQCTTNSHIETKSFEWWDGHHHCPSIGPVTIHKYCLDVTGSQYSCKRNTFLITRGTNHGQVDRFIQSPQFLGGTSK